MNRSKIRNLTSAIPFERGANHHISANKNTINGIYINVPICVSAEYQYTRSILLYKIQKYRNGIFKLFLNNKFVVSH